MKTERQIMQVFQELGALSEMAPAPDTTRLLRLVLASRLRPSQVSALILALAGHLDSSGMLAQRLSEILPDT